MTVTTADFLDTTPPVHPAANPQQRALLEWANANIVERPQPTFDHRRRYKLPHPDTGQDRSWTRMSTLVKTIDDTTGLEAWRTARIIEGLTANPQLLNGLADEDSARKAAANRAAQLGGDKLSADLGTAMHTALEVAALGHDARPPAPYDADLAAILTALRRYHIDLPHLELVVVNPDLDAAGRLDAIATSEEWSLPRIADLKTGKTLNLTAHAAQLAGYATATHIWSPDGYQPMHEVDSSKGLIIHAPLGTGTCTLYTIDLTEGLDIARLCTTVRERRRGSKKLAAPLSDAGAAVDQATPLAGLDGPSATGAGESRAPAPVSARTDWIIGRIRAIRDCGDPRGVEALTRFWPADTAKAPPWTDPQLADIDELLTQVEVLDSVPFPPPDPSAPPIPSPWKPAPPTLPDAPIDDTPASEADHAELVAAVAFLTEEERALAAGWQAQGRNSGRPWGYGEHGKARLAAINTAAIACARHLDDPDATRCALEAVLEHPAPWPIGAVLGCLTTDQAKNLAAYAERIADGDLDTVTDLGRRLTDLLNQSNEPTNQGDNP